MKIITVANQNLWTIFTFENHFPRKDSFFFGKLIKSSLIQVNITREFNQSWAAPTELRLNEVYVVVYSNIARLLVQGIIPFICLIFLNYRIYWVMKRRRQLANRPQQPANTLGATAGHMTAQQKKANEAQQAVVLSIIVVLFFVCHTPRFIVNLHEFIVSNFED